MAFLALAMGVCASAQVVYSIDFSTCTAAVSTSTANTMINGSAITGATITGNGNFEFTPKKDSKDVIAKQTCKAFDKVNGTQNFFGLKVQGGDEVIKLEIEDGFLEDDVIKVYGYIKSSDKTKSVCLKMTAEGGDASIMPDGYVWDDEAKKITTGNGFANGDGTVDEKTGVLTTTGFNIGKAPSVLTFTMQDGADYVNFFRQSAVTGSASTAYITKIEVVRGGSTPIKSINADSLPAGKSVKTIEDGKVIIIRDGVKYNMNGSIIK